LIAALKDKNENVRMNAVEVLRLITGTDFGRNQVEEWQRWWKQTEDNL
jgi:hypothetical protein